MKFMHPFGPAPYFFWPQEKEDICFVPVTNINSVVNTPLNRSSGRMYSFPLKERQSILSKLGRRDFRSPSPYRSRSRSRSPKRSPQETSRSPPPAPPTGNPTTQLPTQHSTVAPALQVPQPTAEPAPQQQQWPMVYPYQPRIYFTLSVTITILMVVYTR